MDHASPSDGAPALAAFDRTLIDLSNVNARRKELEASVRQNEDEAVRALGVSDDWTRAADVIRSFSDEASDRLRSDIERLVSHGLTSVFGEPMDFKVTTRLLRGSPSVEFSLVVSGVERPVMGSHGGGVAQVVGFVLRVVVLLLDKANRPVLILDEPFSAVSPDFRPRLAGFIRELVDSTPLQLILVTHDSDLPAVADLHYEFSRHGDRTVAVRKSEA